MYLHQQEEVALFHHVWLLIWKQIVGVEWLLQVQLFHVSINVI